jgi:hypothetical protein
VDTQTVVAVAFLQLWLISDNALRTSICSNGEAGCRVRKVRQGNLQAL